MCNRQYRQYLPYLHYPLIPRMGQYLPAASMAEHMSSMV